VRRNEENHLEPCTYSGQQGELQASLAVSVIVTLCALVPGAKASGMFGSPTTTRHATTSLATRPRLPFCPSRKTLFRGGGACGEAGCGANQVGPSGLGRGRQPVSTYQIEATGTLCVIGACGRNGLARLTRATDLHFSRFDIAVRLAHKPRQNATGTTTGSSRNRDTPPSHHPVSQPSSRRPKVDL
jgi:hypothetical protein